MFSYACPASAGRLHPMTNERSSLLFLCESRKEEFLRTSDSMVLYARTYGPYEEASENFELHSCCAAAGMNAVKIYSTGLRRAPAPACLIRSMNILLCIASLFRSIRAFVFNHPLLATILPGSVSESRLVNYFTSNKD